VRGGGSDASASGPLGRRPGVGDSTSMLESVFDSTLMALALLIVGAAIAWKIL